MIKFFRHIRKSLLQQNKMGKYFKYAFGEIVLVVIGILIALQINNWNENRKIKNQQKNLYKQLLSDLKADSIFFYDRLTGIEITRNTFKAIKSFEEDPNFDIGKINTNGEGSILVYSGIRNTSNVFDNNEDIYNRLINENIKESIRKYRAIYGYVLLSYKGLNNKLTEISNTFNSKYYKELRINKKDSSLAALKTIYSDAILRSNVDRTLELISITEKRTKEFINQNKQLSLRLKKALKND